MAVDAAESDTALARTALSAASVHSHAVGNADLHQAQQIYATRAGAKLDAVCDNRCV